MPLNTLHATRAQFLRTRKHTKGFQTTEAVKRQLLRCGLLTWLDSKAAHGVSIRWGDIVFADFERALTTSSEC